MIMFFILSMTVIVFVSRYLFLEPRIPLKLNKHAQKLLSYSSPVVLTALWAPIVFSPNGELLFRFDNAYLIGAIVTCLLIWRTNNVLLTIVMSMGVFLFFKLIVFS
jgi:branched-subunit amino acid transport protein